jgi:hypothetical protein
MLHECGSITHLWCGAFSFPQVKFQSEINIKKIGLETSYTCSARCLLTEKMAMEVPIFHVLIHQNLHPTGEKF